MDPKPRQIAKRLWNPFREWCYRDMLARLWVPESGVWWTVLALAVLAVIAVVIFVGVVHSYEIEGSDYGL